MVALVEDLVDRARCDDRLEVRVELAAFAPLYAVGRPGVHEVRALREVTARVDVVVARGDDEAVARLPVHEVGDGSSHVRAAGHGNAAALAEVDLHVDDDQSSVQGVTAFSIEDWSALGRG
ncbi:hypothetical protein GCM10009533_55570 [Saccharopolyspora spinosporotrichia]|uniref:Uncharacterized protein n=1 Tax=Saccharopolyspora erythraea TaxID=1836 RepID=A0ABN1DRR5_SACER